MFMSLNNISVIIHTHSEEKNIQACIESAKLLSKEIIVVDMYSLDKTVYLVKKMGAKVFSFPYSSYVEPAREFGIKQAKTEWVFLLDADERITQELAEEIKKTINNDSGQAGMTFSHYRVPRKNIFAKVKWLKHGGWWPDDQIRLVNKNYFVSWPKEIHSTPIIKGQLGYLQNPITHYFHGDFASMVEKTIVFEGIESDLLYKGNKHVATPTFFRKFLGELYRRLIKGLGFLDGEIGIIESIYQAFSKTITYLFLYEKRLNIKKKKRSTLRSLS